MKQTTQRILFLFFCFAFCGLSLVSAQSRIRIRVFASKPITQCNIQHLFGRYEIILDNATAVPLQRSQRFQVSITNRNQVKLTCNDSLWGYYQKVQFVSTDLKAFYSLTPQNPPIASRKYDDNLEITPNSNELLFVNVVQFENYLGGVVQSETWGATRDPNFFRVQAIISRNYALSNVHKHQKDKYHLCDGVHCQAYYGRANQSEVLSGAYHSRGEIIVDSADRLIEALFHSNSGGQTANAKDVWGNATPYLISQQDSFSLGGKAATWEKTIPMNEWLRFFRSKGIAAGKSEIKEQLLSFVQDSGRKTHILGVKLPEVRKAFGLRSTYFSVQPWGGAVKLTGKGYGHGVGLSQEGAIKMCQEGYEYYEVLEYYYPGAHVKKIDEAQAIKHPFHQPTPLEQIPEGEKNEPNPPTP